MHHDRLTYTSVGYVLVMIVLICHRVDDEVQG